MGIFKLPVINIGGRKSEPRPAFPAIPPFDATPIHPPREEMGTSLGGGGSSPPLISVQIPKGQVAAGTRVRRGDGGRGSAAVQGVSYTDIPTMFLDNAKEVIARCIQAGIIGDSAARDYFRAYSSYLEEEPSDGYQDFLSFAFGQNDEQFTQIATVLNSSLDYPLTRLELDPLKISGGLNGVTEGDLGSLCRRIRVPPLAASTTDLVVLGVANPYLARHAEAAFKEELAGAENSYRFYLLLSPAKLRAAINKEAEGAAALAAAGSAVAAEDSPERTGGVTDNS